MDGHETASSFLSLKKRYGDEGLPISIDYSLGCTHIDVCRCC